MFIKSASSEIFNVLLQAEMGVWVISYDNPSPPIFIPTDALSEYERVETPSEYVIAKSNPLTKAAQRKYELIRPLVGDLKCIYDKKYRQEIIKKVAKDNHINLTRLNRLYYYYLASGRLYREKKRDPIIYPHFDAAIKKYYFSAKKISLRMCYELMLLDNYTHNGELEKDIPTFDCFRGYYCRHYSNNPQKGISRNGLGNYKRNERPLFGSAMAYRQKIGSYCIDETPSDVFVVSHIDRGRVLGRPYIYLAVDTATQMIVGVYVGMESGENALLSCIANAAMDKVDFCNNLGVNITKKEWPCVGMPSEIITDRGREFCGERTNELCLKYGVDLNCNEPFRPDLKSLVERNIGLIQDSYKSMLNGFGTIGVDAAERWAVDYRKQAVLTLQEYKAIVIHCILTINNRVLDDIGHLPTDAPNTPINLWNWMLQRGESALLQADKKDIYIRTLPREKGTVDRKGIFFNKIRYVPIKRHKLTVGEKVEFAYDNDNCTYIYLINKDKSFVPFQIAESSQRYKNLSAEEIKAVRKAEKVSKSKDERIETEMRVRLRKNIQNIVINAANERRKLV